MGAWCGSLTVGSGQARKEPLYERTFRVLSLRPFFSPTRHPKKPPKEAVELYRQFTKPLKP